MLQDSDNCNIIKELYGVPIDGTILLEALVLMSQARDTGLLFHENASKTSLCRVKEKNLTNTCMHPYHHRYLRPLFITRI